MWYGSDMDAVFYENPFAWASHSILGVHSVPKVSNKCSSRQTTQTV